MHLLRALLAARGTFMEKLKKKYYSRHQKRSDRLLRIWDKDTIPVKLQDGLNHSIHVKVVYRPSYFDRLEDRKIIDAVKSKVTRQLSSGVPVARYDIERRKVFLEYPDGRIEYKEEA